MAVATDTSTAAANSSMRMVAARNRLASTYSAMRRCAGVSVGRLRAMRSEIEWPFCMVEAVGLDVVWCTPFS
ncbi:hypothetical protein D3C72_1999590 [compost metagenome]